jgi:thiamine biosynthesis protein ThiS
LSANIWALPITGVSANLARQFKRGRVIMLIIVNGREEQIAQGSALAEYIRSKDLASGEFIYILNEMLIERERLENTILKERDRLEVLKFVGGG